MRQPISRLWCCVFVAGALFGQTRLHLKTGPTAEVQQAQPIARQSEPARRRSFDRQHVLIQFEGVPTEDGGGRTGAQRRPVRTIRSGFRIPVLGLVRAGLVGNQLAGQPDAGPGQGQPGSAKEEQRREAGRTRHRNSGVPSGYRPGGRAGHGPAGGLRSAGAPGLAEQPPADSWAAGEDRGADHLG